MKDAVPKNVDFQISEIVRWITCARQHVMLLQHLMKNDAVEEAA
jgi:hypothetical protein